MILMVLAAVVAVLPVSRNVNRLVKNEQSTIILLNKKAVLNALPFYLKGQAESFLMQ